jgi:hypothetical protein
VTKAYALSNGGLLFGIYTTFGVKKFRKQVQVFEPIQMP